MRKRAVFAALTLAAALLVPLAGSSATAAPAWTGTWATAAQRGSATFNSQTLRQIVHTSIGGTAARVRLSNVYGTQPLTVANVHVAKRTTGSSIDAGSD